MNKPNQNQVNYLQEFVNIVLEYINNPIIQANVQQVPNLKDMVEQQVVTKELADCMVNLNQTTQKAISVLTLLEKESTNAPLQ